MEWAPSGFCRLQHFNFGHDAGSFRRQSQTHAVIVRLGKLAGLEFKTQVAQVFIDHSFALIKISGPGLDCAGICIPAGIENVDKDAGGQHAARHLDDVIDNGGTHISVSRRARSRKASRSGARFMSAAATGAARIFQVRISRTTSSNPNPSPAAGSTQASNSKPCVEGSTTAVTPHLVRNQFNTASSSLVFLTLALSSRIIWSEFGQPTWLHFSSICEQLQVHMILLPRFWNRAS